MTMTLELTPDELAVLRRRADADGVDIETALHRLIAQSDAPVPGPGQKTPGQKTPGQAWFHGDDTADPEERAERAREQAEVQANIKRWHAEHRPPDAA